MQNKRREREVGCNLEEKLNKRRETTGIREGGRVFPAPAWSAWLQPSGCFLPSVTPHPHPEQNSVRTVWKGRGVGRTTLRQEDK